MGNVKTTRQCVEGSPVKKGAVKTTRQCVEGSPVKKGAFRGYTCLRPVRTIMRKRHVSPGTGRSDCIHRRILHTWVHGLSTGVHHQNIDKDRKIEVCHVKGLINSLKKQGARLNDVTDTTIAIRLQEFHGQFLSVVSGQLWCGPS